MAYLRLFILKLSKRGGSGVKGIILAGGLGTRLHPLTRITNKHLLPVYDKPMIFYSIEMLVNAGIDDIMVITGGTNSGDFLRLLGNGKHFGLKHIHYGYQAVSYTHLTLSTILRV